MERLGFILAPLFHMFLNFFLPYSCFGFYLWQVIFISDVKLQVIKNKPQIELCEKFSKLVKHGIKIYYLEILRLKLYFIYIKRDLIFSESRVKEGIRMRLDVPTMLASKKIKKGKIVHDWRPNQNPWKNQKRNPKRK